MAQWEEGEKGRDAAEPRRSALRETVCIRRCPVERGTVDREREHSVVALVDGSCKGHMCPREGDGV